ncbi:DUF1223 domain-containing protein [Aminobacter sp. Piv2-1]|uniref:DUF1223 domain-containing protein n=1 Tax=Aminobacter sp. Piv2-1 TaxID=3031122 RepID=UPI003094E9EE
MEFRASRWLAGLVLAVGAIAGSATAEAKERPLGVIELFTSQGCSACPPADELFAEFAGRDDIVALAYHVTYWDYLGWQDNLASKENTDRQYGYMRAFGARAVYTPQAVVNGRTHMSGAKRDDITQALDNLEKTGQGLNVDIHVSESADTISIDVGQVEGPQRINAHLVLVYFGPPQLVDLQRGENQGRRITYWNAVSDVNTAGMWHGEEQRFDLPRSEVEKKGGAAVLLQAVGKDGLPGPILGAAVIRKAPGPVR